MTFSPQDFSWRRHPLLSLAMAIIAAFALYWLLLASDRFESEARVVLERADIASGQTTDFASLLGGVTGGNRADQLLMRDHLMSIDVLRQLDQELKLRQHYSGQGDWLSRLWDAEAPVETLKEYLHTRISVELDEFSGVLVIKAQAYTPEMAQAITAALLREGERHMNALGHALAQEQVRYLEDQVSRMGERVTQTRQALLAFQNQKGLVSPQATAESLAAITAGLEAKLTELRTRRAGLLGFLQPSAAQVVELNLQIAAVEDQIKQERARLAAPGGKTLNTTVEQFQRLQLEAEFAQQVFNTALTALEQGRVQATRTLKKVSVLQSANLPEYPLQPRRLYNAAVAAIVVLLLAGVLHLLLAIVRDHQD